MGRLQEALDHAVEQLEHHKAAAAKYAKQASALRQMVKDKAVAEALDEVMSAPRPRRPKSADDVAAQPKQRKCSNCGKPGHIARKCPKAYEPPDPPAPTSATVQVKSMSVTRIHKPSADDPVPVTQLAVELKVNIKRLWTALREQKIDPLMVSGVAHVKAADVERVRQAVAA